MNSRLVGLALIFSGLGWLGSFHLIAADEAIQTGGDFFETRIRPVLAQRCFQCHSDKKQEGQLRLDRRDDLLKGGKSGRVVLPGDPGHSLLLRAIRRVDKDFRMPPPEKDKLTDIEIRDFEAWITMGAPWPDDGNQVAKSPVSNLEEARRFWSLQPVSMPQPPSVDAGDTGTRDWPANEIDQFVLARLAEKGWRPSPRADKRTLLRRATYDLTGLPPTPPEIDAFLADVSPDAFEKVVDRLLASPQYGVHWARHWFDVARYGDTRWVGAGEDRRWPFAYTYRDWVIQALNEDMPYDRFVTLQLAADQVPDARPGDQAALGFLTVGRWFTGKLPDVIDDQIDVVTRGLLGLTAQCARCHDHKYDPVSMQDYYSIYGLFAASRMPVDGNGILGCLPALEPRPVDEATEIEIAKMRAGIDEFLDTRVNALSNDFRNGQKLLRYFRLATKLLEKDDNDVRYFSTWNEVDDRLLLRWVRYLKRTLPKPQGDPHPVFAPWHKLAAVRPADFPATTKALLENQKADKLNPQVAAMLTPPPGSLDELATRYVDLFLKFDGEDRYEDKADYDKERLRQVLRGNDSPTYVKRSELGQFLTPEEFENLTGLRRELHAKLVELPEKADHFLTYLHEVKPLKEKLDSFLDERSKAVASDVRSPEKIAKYLLAAHEARDAESRKFRELAKSGQLSTVTLQGWIDFLDRLAQQKDPVFAAWRVFTADNNDFATQSCQIAKRAKDAAGNSEVAALFEPPPSTLAEAAERYSGLLAKCLRDEPFANPGLEAVRKVITAKDSPLRFSLERIVDYLTQQETDQLRNHERNLARVYLESPGTPALGMVLRETSSSYDQRIFVRGNPNNEGEMSHSSFLRVLADGPDARPFTPGLGRRELANSIVCRSNPLAARVIVNRAWQWHFGTGIVRTPSDFGTRGELPSHPLLLDWLASRLVEDGWSLKQLHRRILLSSTWQQSSQDNPAYRSVDPGNRMLWRMNRRRLGFEELRDSLLAAASRLDMTFGGRPDDLEKDIARRRTVFGKVDRMTLPGFYRYFDFPGADTHVPQRQETIVAQQALYLMNNSFVLDQAGHLARQTETAPGTNARIDAMYRQVFGRSPTSEESELCEQFLHSQEAAKPAEGAEDNATPSVPPASKAWQYGWGSYDEASQRVTAFNPFRFSTGDRWRGGPNENDPELGRIYLHSRQGYAGPDSRLCVVRRWIAPCGGILSITGKVSAELNSTEPRGDGVRARIVSSRQGQLGVWLVCGTEEATDVAKVEVKPGDNIDFVTDARGRESTGTFLWSPVLTMKADEGADPVTPEAKGLAWDAQKDFKAPKSTGQPPFDAWQRLGQILLESNEFTFLD